MTLSLQIFLKIPKILNVHRCCRSDKSAAYMTTHEVTNQISAPRPFLTIYSPWNQRRTLSAFSSPNQCAFVPSVRTVSLGVTPFFFAIWAYTSLVDGNRYLVG